MFAPQAARAWEFELQGGFLRRQQFSGPATAKRVDIFNGPTALGTDTINARDNWTGRASLRHRMWGDGDLGISFTGIIGTTSERTLSSALPVVLIFPALMSSPIISAVGGMQLIAKTRANQHVVDIDAGFYPMGDSIKILAGARFTQFWQKTDLTLPEPFFPVPSQFIHARTDEFIGAGPRLGAQGALQLRGGFALNAGAAGAVVFGQQKFRAVTTGFGGVATGVSMKGMRASLTTPKAK